MTARRAAATVTIQNELGLHARPAMNFVDAAVGCVSAIFIRKGDQQVDGKSIMQVLILAATKGTEIEIIAEGDDADEAVARLVALVNSKFGE